MNRSPLLAGRITSYNVCYTKLLRKTLIELDLRSRFQVNVLGIKDVLTDHFIPFPPPDRVIRDSDILIMAGHPEQLEKACSKKGG